MLKLMPNARPSRAGPNHRPSAAITATIIDSAPRPNSRRPNAMVVKSGETAVSTAPRRQITANQKVDRPAPKRSTMTPPIRTMRMFGAL
jgi:hypothetical protein